MARLARLARLAMLAMLAMLVRAVVDGQELPLAGCLAFARVFDRSPALSAPFHVPSHQPRRQIWQRRSPR
ncbi:hypothetical protein DICSQDRAFT_150553 [Dichomitus squalens LYAD-421 SS1]|uniref:Secreted protein n=1 Tax=Dichomitus squalens (strain LYAD-421) TaxID=732165 RepID=R7SMG3_DICSQ|nr:uncharacterized protein DICSQDRAFT_150553 [Dichomitus squalens LYAD-421 SS1]EJF56162.1 hypothetical protein DICSQDRAFT_150553 [Dichomitus squalens LYAD-421 SS1]